MTSSLLHLADAAKMLRGGGIGRCFGDSSSESGGDEERLSDDEVTVVRTVTTRPLMSLPAAAAEVKVEPVQSQTRRVAVSPEEYPRNLADLSQRDERWLLASLVRVGQRKKGCAGRPVSFRPQAKALFGSLVAARKAGALHAGSSSSSSTDRFKRKVDGDFSPLEDTGTPWKVQTAKGRRRKPADVERTDIPAAQTTPLKHHTHFLGEAGGPCNSCSGSDAECIDVISSVTETPLAPNSDVDSRSARVATIPHSSSPSDGASPSPTGSPSSCPATSPVVSATHSALCSPSGSPSGSPRGSPGVREGVGAGGSPSVGADGGSPSGVNAGGSAGGSAMVSAGGGAVAVGAVEKKGTARSNRTSKKKNKKPEAAVKTAEVLALEAFEKSLQPEPPVHAVVPETPTPWAYLPSDRGGPAKELDFLTGRHEKRSRRWLGTGSNIFCLLTTPWWSIVMVAVVAVVAEVAVVAVAMAVVVRR